MSRYVIYLAAPVSSVTAEGVADNLSRARRWLKWFIDNTDHAMCASWMPYVETLAEETYRARGLQDDLTILERCDAIVCVGGRVSSGMKLELDHAHRRGLRLCSLIGFGAEPPDGTRTLAALAELDAELAGG